MRLGARWAAWVVAFGMSGVGLAQTAGDDTSPPAPLERELKSAPRNQAIKTPPQDPTPKAAPSDQVDHAVGGSGFPNPAPGQDTLDQRLRPPRRMDYPEFLAELSLANQWQLQLGQQALGKAHDADVKALAQSLIAQRQALDAKLTELAAKKKVDLKKSLDDTDSTGQQLMHLLMLGSLDGLQLLGAESYDRAFLASVVMAEDLTVAKLREMDRNLEGAQIHPIVRDEIPKLLQLRDQAYALLGEVAPVAPRGQARHRPSGR